MNKRLFFLTNHICVGESGGGHGVEYRLHQANVKYNLFGVEVIYIFGDRVIEGNASTGKLKENKDQPQKSAFRLSLRKYIPSWFRLIKMKKMYKMLDSYLADLDNRYHFSEEDVYVFHDVKMAKAFLERFSYSKNAIVYHKQGSIYNEWSADTGLQSRIMQTYYNDMFRFISKNVRYFCFPSKGSEESLITSAPELREDIEKTERKYLYNGVFCPDVIKENYPDWIKEIDNFEGYKFVTVANLNAAKAVERIPQYINSLKKAGINVKWILIGNGVQAEAVEKEIEKCDISDNVIWKKGNVFHSELMELFSVTNFYILFHKYSIFDLSTLEAMHYGNIPVLTPVGGNKEVIIQDNGLFVSNFSDAETFIHFVNSNDLKNLSELNKNIKRELFDEKAFLKRYVELYELLDMEGK